MSIQLALQATAYAIALAEDLKFDENALQTASAFLTQVADTLATLCVDLDVQGRKPKKEG